MKDLIKTTKTEWLKLKGLGLVYAAVVLSLLGPLLQFFSLFMSRNYTNSDTPSINVFEDFLVENLSPYPKFFLVLFIIIAANRICQTDHKNGGWLLMETQPVSKLYIYLAKYLNLLFLTFISIVAFFIFCYLFSVVWELSFSTIKRSWSFDPAFHLQTFLKMYISSWGTVAFLLFVSVIIPGYLWPFSIGILGLILNFTSLATKKPFPYSPLFPELLAFPHPNVNVRNLNTFLGYSEVLSIFWTLLFTLTGYIIYREKNIQRALSGNWKNRLRTLTILVIFTGLYFRIERPVTLQSDTNITRIHGRFQGVRTPKSFLVINPDLNVEIAKFDISGQQFSWETKEEIPLATYLLISNDGSVRENIVLGTGDYYEFTFAMNPFSYKKTYKSDRKAENELFNRGFSGNMSSLLYRHKKDPEAYYREMEKAWHKSLKELNAYKTSENYGPREDFRTFKSQLLAIEYLNTLKNYRKDNPAAGAVPAGFMGLLKNRLNEPTHLTLRDDRFVEYKLAEFLPDAGTVNNPDSLIFAQLAKTERGKLRDRLLKTHLITNLELVESAGERESVLNTNLDKIDDPAYRKAVTDKYEAIVKSQKGAPFPAMEMLDASGKKFTWEDFKNKYIIIDLWATWCGPCLAIKPVFERRAYDHIYFKNLVFVSLSIDKEKDKWNRYMQNTPSKDNIRDLWLENAEDHLRGMDIEFIPRFMIVDPEGKVYNADAPKPDDHNFLEILKSIRKYN